jgi:hypothetical protein
LTSEDCQSELLRAVLYENVRLPGRLRCVRLSFECPMTVIMWLVHSYTNWDDIMYTEVSIQFFSVFGLNAKPHDCAVNATMRGARSDFVTFSPC